MQQVWFVDIDHFSDMKLDSTIAADKAGLSWQLKQSPNLLFLEGLVGTVRKAYIWALQKSFVLKICIRVCVSIYLYMHRDFCVNISLPAQCVQPYLDFYLLFSQNESSTAHLVECVHRREIVLSYFHCIDPKSNSKRL